MFNIIVAAWLALWDVIKVAGVLAILIALNVVLFFIHGSLPIILCILLYIMLVQHHYRELIKNQRVIRPWRY